MLVIYVLYDGLYYFETGNYNVAEKSVLILLILLLLVGSGHRSFSE